MKTIPLFTIRKVKLRTARKFARLARKAKKYQCDFLDVLIESYPHK